MEMFKMMNIKDDIVLIVPIDADMPLSKVIDEFNSINQIPCGIAIIDLLVYKGNSKNRFQYCKIIKSKIYMECLSTYNADDSIIEKSYELFSYLSLGSISKIISPTIRKKILEKKSDELCYIVSNLLPHSQSE